MERRPGGVKLWSCKLPINQKVVSLNPARVLYCFAQILTKYSWIQRTYFLVENVFGPKHLTQEQPVPPDKYVGMP
jgi:hypothetical protein